MQEVVSKSKYGMIEVIVKDTGVGIKEENLQKAGFNCVIYANQITRAIYPAIENVLKTILRDGRSYKLNNSISEVKKLLNFIPEM
jgi:phosphoenolpyruvate phosphomutase